MNRWMKFGLVIGGSVTACLIAGFAVYVNQLLRDSAASQSSAGMSAFGDFMLFILTFGVLGLLPTGFALYFLTRKFLQR
jgi:hypothetical protein